MKIVVLLVSCLLGVSTAFPYWPWGAGNPYGYAPYYNPYYWFYNYAAAPFYATPGYPAAGQKQAFYGEFRGTCEGSQDGLYYVDDRSFAFCSGGQKTVQPCPEGTSNPPVTAFTAGELYGFFDFCSVNLLASGYYPFAAPAKHSPPTEINYDAPKAEKKTEQPKY